MSGAPSRIRRLLRVVVVNDMVMVVVMVVWSDMMMRGLPWGRVHVLMLWRGGRRVTMLLLLLLLLHELLHMEIPFSFAFTFKLKLLPLPPSLPLTPLPYLISLPPPFSRSLPVPLALSLFVVSHNSQFSSATLAHPLAIPSGAPHPSMKTPHPPILLPS